MVKKGYSKFFYFCSDSKSPAINLGLLFWSKFEKYSFIIVNSTEYFFFNVKIEKTQALIIHSLFWEFSE
jgi:hypothetical protein